MATSAGEPFIGIDYGRVANNLPSPTDVVKLLRSRDVRNVKIYDADQNVLAAFKDSGIKLSVAVPNDKVVAIANSQDFSDKWVTDHIVKYNGIITSIGMGNEWLNDSNHDPLKLVPAMEKLYTSLQKRGLTSKIKVSTPHAFDVEGFPPSAGEFRRDQAAVMKSLLNFLHDKKSYFMLNVYPFFEYAKPNSPVGTDYALFKAKKPVVKDPGTGLEYTNLFDAMLDTAISAMTRLGHPNMPIVITETGWPNGGSGRRGVGVEDARYYNQSVIKHVLGKKGTPLRLGHSFPTYIFALFNENGKSGGHGDEEKHWGHFSPDMKPIYPLRMSG